MRSITVKLRVSETAQDIPLPLYQTLGAAGMDLYAAENLMVGKGETAMVSTGLFVEIPEGYEIQIRSRSGMASKGIFVTNSPGTIDSDYRGEIKVLLTNSSAFDFPIWRGDRIAQALLAEVIKIHWEVVDELSDTIRGDGGYGSTGA